MGEKEIVMQRICRAGMVLGVALTLAGCGNDGLPAGAKADGAVETWDGARADLAEGRRPKEAVYHYGNKESSITYDLEGNIIGVAGANCSREDFTRVLDADGALYDYTFNSSRGEMKKSYWEYAPENYNVQTRLLVREDKEYFFAESGALQQEQANDESEIIDYSYDSQGRLIKEVIETKDKDEKPDVSPRITRIYDYEKNLLLSSMKWVIDDDTPDISTYEREYDAFGNIVCLRYYGKISKWIEEWEYDEEGKLLSYKHTEGHRSWESTDYEICSIIRYNDSEDIVEESKKIIINGKEYTIEKTEYLYDEDGRRTEQNTYELLAERDWGERKQADWCNGGGNTELYLTRKWEYKYSGQDTVKKRETSYQYEANKDYSKVNLTATNEGEWQESQEPQETETAYWTITYYTEEEVEQYLHDQEFSPVK